MKFLLILLIVTVFFGTLETSYSQWQLPQNVENLPKVLLQIQLRNSDDQLVAYVEGTKIMRINEKVLNEHLDSLGSSRIITIEDKNYELFQWQGRTETFARTHSISMYALKVLPIDGQHQNALLINYEAYQVEPGDKILIYWTIMRPVVNPL